MKILTVLGARPQFIKSALLSKELRKIHEEIIVHTGQHYNKEMSDIFFDEMKIPQPDYNLGIGSDSHARQTGQMMISLERLFLSENPELVLTYGDTNSTLAAALTASKLNIPIAHVEAGPRMFDKTIPEEVNRIVTDHISTLLFAPTSKSLENLNREGLSKGAYLTGDVMFDNYNHFLKKAEKSSKILETLNLEKKEYILVTVHRARNTDVEENLKNIIVACSIISKEIPIVFPLHPRTEKFLTEYGLMDRFREFPNMHIIKPVGYYDMLVLTKNAKKIVTDSGGLQKESYFAQVPCITLDNSSAWPETVESGLNVVIGEQKYLSSSVLRDFVFHFGPSNVQSHVFGKGDAVIKICQKLDSFERYKKC